MHEGHIGRWQQLVMKMELGSSLALRLEEDEEDMVFRGGREEEQARQRIVLRSRLLLPTSKGNTKVLEDIVARVVE